MSLTYEQGYADAKKEFERPKGNCDDWKCSECGEITLQRNFNFCPWCGAQWKEVKNERTISKG